ncbi:MAG: hypothetical protein WC919_03805 [Candidatus Paceibacterota bacterium]
MHKAADNINQRSPAARGEEPERTDIQPYSFEDAANELGVDLQTFFNLVSSGSGSTYGRSDVKDTTLYNVRSLRNLKILLDRLGVARAVAHKLFRFYLDNYRVLRTHRSGNPANISDEDALKQLLNRERLVCLIDEPHIDTVRGDNRFIIRRYGKGVFYVARREDKDVVDEIQKTTHQKTSDLLRGMAFGYRPEEVFSFVRSKGVDVDKEVDDLVGDDSFKQHGTYL